jgi:hypothetical protein
LYFDRRFRIHSSCSVKRYEVKYNMYCGVFEFLAGGGVNIKTVAFWDATPCSLVDMCRSFGETCRIMYRNPKQKTGSIFILYVFKIGRSVWWWIFKS